MSIGSFTMCISAVASFAAAMRNLADRLTEIHAYDFYYVQLDAYLHIPQLLRAGKKRTVPHKIHRIEFCDVGFCYPGAENWALRHVDLMIEEGQVKMVRENLL